METGGETNTVPVSFLPLEEGLGAPRGRPRRPKKAPRRRSDVRRGGPREAVRTAAESIRRVEDGRQSPQRCTGAPREAQGVAREGQNRQRLRCFTRHFALVDSRVHVSRKEVERHPERPKVGRRTEDQPRRARRGPRNWPGGLPERSLRGPGNVARERGVVLGWKWWPESAR